MYRRIQTFVTAPEFAGAVNICSADPSLYTVAKTPSAKGVRGVLKKTSSGPNEVFITWGTPASIDLKGSLSSTCLACALDNCKNTYYIPAMGKKQKAIQVVLPFVHVCRLAGFIGALRHSSGILFPVYQSGLTFKTMLRGPGTGGSPQKPSSLSQYLTLKQYI